jgi:hypothetical protein
VGEKLQMAMPSRRISLDNKPRGMPVPYPFTYAGFRFISISILALVY